MSEVPGYRRELDLGTAVSSVTFTVGGVTYTPEAFASYPDGVIGVRTSADRPGTVSLTARVTSPHETAKAEVTEGRIVLSGALASNGVALEAQLLVRAEGGTAPTTPTGCR